MSILFRLHAVVLAASLSVASLAPSCSGRPITPVPAPRLHPVAITVFGPNGAVAGATVNLQGGIGGVVGEDCLVATNAAGYAICPLVPNTLVDSHVSVQADGYLDFSSHVTLSPGQAQTIRIGDPGNASVYDIHLDGLKPVGPSPATIAGRVRSVGGRFVNDAGPFQWRGISEFDFVHLVRTGNEAELVRRLTRGTSVGQRNVFRVFARAVNLFDLNHAQAGYWEALDRTIALVNGAGAYVELCYLPDAQSLDSGTRRMLVQQYGSRYRDNPGVIAQIANEPWQNGWSSAVDPALLDLGDLLASVLGHRDFSIGDPADGDDQDASAETAKEAVTLGRHSNIIVIHSSRKGGAAPESERYRRYIDHGESFYDVMSQVRQVNANASCVNDEPMGVAGIRWVPLAGGKTYEREFEPEAVLADELTTLTIGCGHTLHYISAQNDSLPGLDLLGRISPRLPADASWSYRNDSWSGSATRGFTGFGKCRTYTNGSEAYVTCNGTNKGGVNWANGFAPNETLFDGSHVSVWHAQH